MRSSRPLHDHAADFLRAAVARLRAAGRAARDGRALRCAAARLSFRRATRSTTLVGGVGFPDTWGSFLPAAFALMTLISTGTRGSVPARVVTPFFQTPVQD